MHTMTYHAVDDDRTVTACHTVDLFLELFQLPLLMCKMAPGCEEVHFRLQFHQYGEPYLERAQRIISSLRLPLRASLKVSELNGLIYDTRLVLQFTEQ